MASCFYVKKKLPAECNYEIFDKELLAIVNAFETWTAELGSVESTTIVLSDHKNLEHFTTTKKLAWQHAKYEITAVPDALTVELNVPGNIHKRFHVELVKRAGNDPLPSQARDDTQSPAIQDELGESEYEIESILRARTAQRGRGKYRQALVKWVGWVDLTWEPIEFIKDTAALQEFEAKYGPITHNNGPSEQSIGTHVGPAETHTNGPSEQSIGTHVGPAETHTIINRRAKRRKYNKSHGASGGVVTAGKP